MTLLGVSCKVAELEARVRQRELWAVALIGALLCSAVLLLTDRYFNGRGAIVKIVWASALPYTGWGVAYFFVAWLNYAVQDASKVKTSLLDLAAVAMLFPYVACFGFVASLIGIASVLFLGLKGESFAVSSR